MTKAAELAKMGEVLTNGQIGGRRNIIINGAMNVAQRSTSETGKGDANGFFTCDRWRIHVGSTATAGRFTMSQATDVHDGFANALKLDCTTADTSIAAGEQLQLQQRFEGQDLQQLKKGTSDAEKVTVSFYVKGNASATYVCELEDIDNSRNNTQAFSVTTDWTRVILTFDGDTTGALDDDVNRSFNVNFWLHGGSTYSGGTFASNTWASTTDANRYAGSRTSFFDSTDRTFFITGVQLEVGSQATPFEHRSFGEEKKLCERYYFQTQSQNFAGVASATNRLIAGYRIPDMRATPSFTFISYNGTTARLSKATNNADTTFSSASVTSLNGFYQVTSSSNTFVAGEGYFAQLKCDSEI